jgi:hypothetical protein
MALLLRGVINCDAEQFQHGSSMKTFSSKESKLVKL